MVRANQQESPVRMDAVVLPGAWTLTYRQAVDRGQDLRASGPRQEATGPHSSATLSRSESRWESCLTRASFDSATFLVSPSTEEWSYSSA